jgi:hypothetical protein
VHDLAAFFTTEDQCGLGVFDYLRLFLLECSFGAGIFGLAIGIN